MTGLCLKAILCLLAGWLVASTASAQAQGETVSAARLEAQAFIGSWEANQGVLTIQESDGRVTVSWSALPPSDPRQGSEARVQNGQLIVEDLDLTLRLTDGGARLEGEHKERRVFGMRLLTDLSMHPDQITKELQAAIQAAKWADAADAALRWSKLFPFDSSNAYDLACFHALLGEGDEAFRWLETTADCGYSNAAHLEADTDLASLRDDPRWPMLRDKVRENGERHRRAGPKCLRSINHRVAGRQHLWRIGDLQPGR